MGQFQKKAFVSSHFPKDGDRRFEMREHTQDNRSHAAVLSSTLSFALERDLRKPSMLRKAFEAYARNPAQPPGWEARAAKLLATSASCPDLAGSEAVQAEPAAAPSNPANPEKVTAAMLN